MAKGVAAIKIGVGKTRVRGSEFRILGDGLLEISLSLDQILLSALVPEVASMKIGFVSFGADRSSFSKSSFFGRSDLKLDRVGDGLGYVVLYRQNVARVAIVGVSPQVAVRWSVNELRGN